jgi:hypothetical protein
VNDRSSRVKSFLKHWYSHSAEPHELRHHGHGQ